MSVWKLTDDIWWGDAMSPLECRHSAKSVICVAENAELSHHGFSPYLQHLNPPDPRPKPLFWLPINDYVEADKGYVMLLNSVLDVVATGSLFPLLVHCYAGVHRSPATAIYAAVRKQGGGYKDLHEKARLLRPEMEYHQFSKSLHKLMGGEA